jgi:hypothetical protein
MTTKATKRNQSGDDMREQLNAKIEAARASIQRAIIAGDNTLKLREYLNGLLAEKQALDEAAAAQEASQAAAVRRQHDELQSASTVLAESRHARLMLLSDKYRSPVRPSMSHG